MGLLGGRRCRTCGAPMRFELVEQSTVEGSAGEVTWTGARRWYCPNGCSGSAIVDLGKARPSRPVHRTGLPDPEARKATAWALILAMSVAGYLLAFALVVVALVRADVYPVWKLLFAVATLALALYVPRLFLGGRGRGAKGAKGASGAGETGTGETGKAAPIGVTGKGAGEAASAKGTGEAA